MHQNQWHLLTANRFLPLFLTQFSGALNEYILKSALIMWLTHTTLDNAEVSLYMAVMLVAAISILPFFLFSAIAGQVADKWDKAKLIRVIKAIEMLLMGCAAASFLLGNQIFLLGVLFLTGSQSAFFGPLKYAILPELLKENELMSGNVLVHASTFLSIPLGIALGGLLMMEDNGASLISLLILITAVAGWLSSLSVPPVQPASPKIKISYSLWNETRSLLQLIRQYPIVFRSILGIAWVWLAGTAFLFYLALFSKEILGGNDQIAILFLIVFTTGLAIGSLLSKLLLKREIAATYVPLSILGIVIFTVDLFFASENLLLSGQKEMLSLIVFLDTLAHWRLLLDLAGVAICIGIVIVPLYALIQHHTEAMYRSRVIAGNNILIASCMSASILAISILLTKGLLLTGIFLAIAAVSTLVAIYLTSLLPSALSRSMLQWIFHMFYRLEVKGLENYQKTEEKAIIIANHLSALDAILLSVAIPERLCFAVDKHAVQQGWIRPFLFLADTVTIDYANPMSIRLLIDMVGKGQKVVIFPQGRMTHTGLLMKVYDGPAMIAGKSGAMLLPVSIAGAQYTPFSRLKGKIRICWFPKITLTCLQPESFEPPPEAEGKNRRRIASAKLYDIMTTMVFKSNHLEQTVFQSLLDASSTHGRKHIIAEDIDRVPLTYSQLITRSFILGKYLQEMTHSGEKIGVLLPNMTSTLFCFFALQAYGRIPAMLNFSVSRKNLLDACQLAQIKTVITSRKFIEVAELTEMIEGLEARNVSVLFLEDIRKHLPWKHKFYGLIAGLLPRFFYRLTHSLQDVGAPAVVLFTSGTEGAPKGVALSHINLQANRYQVASIIDFGPEDIVFNALPIFHSFGLTGGTLLPILSGIKTFLYPSPLHYRAIPELVYDIDATLLFGTDTFLTGYARYANPHDFYSLRYVFAGAEKLRESTRRIWLESFGVRIFQGYGATETAPILSINTPMHNRAGSVGRLLPGISHKLEEVPGIENGGKLIVCGPNIMKGYYLIDSPGQIAQPVNGWYDMGDVVEIDDEGYIFIKGRVKRFAKIGGEMVSLSAIEEYVTKLWPDHTHAVIQMPDSKKGEQLILITTNPEAKREQLISYVREHGIGELNIPKTILITEQLPVLGTGKTDYVSLHDWVLKKAEAPDA